MKYRLNSYIAILVITMAGATAAFTIVRVATDNMLAAHFQGTEQNYFLLQQSILTNKP